MAGIAIGALARPKALALIALAAISFVAPLAERWATGRVEPFSTYGLVEMAVSLVVLFWWYHVDKAEHAYRAGKLMNSGVLLLAVIALPVYFIRSRGWQRGMRTTALALLFLGVTLALGEAGEWLGAALTS
ncbi:MAG TPA: hypothetical protein VFJ70_04000 [Burkholderiales bacterium]|nr:hypothetical protein [Burkholderiales bacterium]